MNVMHLVSSFEIVNGHEKTLEHYLTQARRNKGAPEATAPLPFPSRSKGGRDALLFYRITFYILSTSSTNEL